MSSLIFSRKNKKKINVICYNSAYHFNPFMPSGLFYLKSLDWLISNRSEVYFSLLLPFLLKFLYLNANNVESDQTHYAASDLGLQSLSMSFLWMLGISGLTLKMPRKPAPENVVCLCRLLNILANFSNLFLHTDKQCGP